MIITRIVQTVMTLSTLSLAIYAGRVALADWREDRLNARSDSTEED